MNHIDTCGHNLCRVWMCYRLKHLYLMETWGSYFTCLCLTLLDFLFWSVNLQPAWHNLTWLCLCSVTMVDHMTPMRLEWNRPLTLGPYFTEPGFIQRGKKAAEMQWVEHINTQNSSYYKIKPCLCLLEWAHPIIWPAPYYILIFYANKNEYEDNVGIIFVFPQTALYELMNSPEDDPLLSVYSCMHQ